jgi:hypothetical protein
MVLARLAHRRAALAALVAALATAGCGGGVASGGGGGTTPPSVLQASLVREPAPLSISVVFSAPPDPASVGPASIPVTGPGGAVAGLQYSFAGPLTVLVTPAAELPEGSYTLSVLAGQLRDARGTAIAQTFTFPFVVDRTEPTLASVSPADDATDVPLGTQVTVTLSEPVAADSVTEATFALIDCDRQPVAGSRQVVGAALTFTPAAPLRPGCSHLVEVSGTTDLAGNATAAAAAFTTTAGAGSGTWAPIADAGAPSDRSGHSAVWTGSEMIVWGGRTEAGAVADGASFSPTAGTWTAVGTAGAPPAARTDHAAVWTGSVAGGRMIVWGGFDEAGPASGGALYDPVADAWTAMSTTDAPSGVGRGNVTWTGTRLVVWGGLGPDGAPVGEGAIYDPAAGPAGTWTPMPTTGAPSPRSEHSVVAVGSLVVVWGGSGADGLPLGDGAVFDLTSGLWEPLNPSGAPSARRLHTAVALPNGEVVVWGGSDDAGELATGARYDPATGAPWTALPLENAPSPRLGHAAVAIGARLLVWGGLDVVQARTGGVFSPAAGASGAWTLTSTAAAPAGQFEPAAVWTGSELLVWGGDAGGGGRFTPAP